MSNQLRFTTVYRDQHDATLIGPKQNNGDFDWYPVITTADMSDYDDYPAKYQCSIYAVSLDELRRTNTLDKVIDCYGRDDPGYVWTDLDLVEAAIGYGASAPLWDNYGDNYADLLQQARREADLACSLTGVYLNRQVNMIGASGWDFIAGSVFPTKS